MPDYPQGMDSPAICFTGSGIDRSAALSRQKEPGFWAEVAADPSSKFMLLRGGAALCEAVTAEAQRLAPVWLALAELEAAGVRLELQPAGSGDSGEQAAITALLGSGVGGVGGAGDWRVAVEWGRHSDAEAEALRAALRPGSGTPLEWCGGRDLYHRLSFRDAAAVGHAVCATGWQLKALRCGVTGRPTVPIEAGAKRKTPRSGGGGGREQRWYPRIDPCCIMLVVSADRQRCLLSHPRRLRAGVFTSAPLLPHTPLLAPQALPASSGQLISCSRPTQRPDPVCASCLAGFIDCCESVEEAVRRETMEEAGIAVGGVELHCSQPWPLGRGGAELMIACKVTSAPPRPSGLLTP